HCTVMPHRFVATRTRFVIIRPRPPMKTIGFILLLAFLSLVPPASRAQSDDPSESFLKAYMTAQQGEKLEHDNQFKAALSKYRFAGISLENLKRPHPDGHPAIVEYRGRKVSEAILRVQDKAGTQEDVAASADVSEQTNTAVQPASPSVQIAKEKPA